jgi:hypothetical protein
VVLVIVLAVTILARRSPTLFRGGHFLVVTGMIVAAAAMHLAVIGEPVPLRVFVIGALALGLALLMSPYWFVIGGTRAAIPDVIQLCFRRVCADFTRSGDGFAMVVPGGAMLVRMHPLPFDRITAISFLPRPAHRKGELFRKLLVKQYAAPYPTLKITSR